MISFGCVLRIKSEPGSGSATFGLESETEYQVGLVSGLVSPPASVASPGRMRIN